MAEWLGEGGRKMAECGMEAPDLVHARTMTYDLECNWKVFNDNYLVGLVSGLPGITLAWLLWQVFGFWKGTCQDRAGGTCVPGKDSCSNGESAMCWPAKVMHVHHASNTGMELSACSL